MNLQNRIIAVLRASGKPLPFEQIYSSLEADGNPMPENKPKLQVRQTLYKKECFDVQKGGLFYIKDDAVVEEPEAAAPVQQTAAKTVAPESEPPVKKAEGPKIKDRVIAILKASDKPMSFEDVYSALEKDGFAMPKSKPKLKVRQVLYMADYFSVAKGGLFTVNDGVEAEEFVPPAPVAEAPQPAVSESAAPAQDTPVAQANVPKIKDRAILILQQAGKPMSFQKIYEALETDGYPMPKSKPKLKVRQALYNADHFKVEKGGLFTVIDGVEADVSTEDKQEQVQAEEKPVAASSEAKPSVAPTLSPKDTAELVAQAREEARIAAREAAAQAREEAIREARESARIAAQEAAAEVAREAALEAAKMAENSEATKRMAIEAAVEAAKSAALEAAREAARIALSETSHAVAEAAAEEAKKLSGNQAEALETPSAEVDPVDQELLEAARAAREAAAQAAAAVDSSLDMTAASAVPAPQPAQPQPSATQPVSKGTSIRERVVQAINASGRPLSFDEIMAELGRDGHPLPMNNAEQVVQRVVENENNFEQVQPGVYSVK